MSNEFGFTNDQEELNAAVAWREAAIKDGWIIEPTYKLEPMESHASLKKEGFHATVMARIKTSGRWKYEAQVSVWGPDRLAIRPPRIYSWEAIVAGLNTCNVCGNTGEMFSYSFAGRCCENCLPDMKKKHEYPGWTN